MLMLGQPEGMSPAIIPTVPPIGPDEEPSSSNQAAASARRATGGQPARPASAKGATGQATPTAAHSNGAPASNGSAAPNGGAVPDELIENLAVRVAAAGDRESIAELVRRAGSARPSGALMVGAVEQRLLAAVSMSTGEVVREPTPAGEAAAAVVRYRLSRLGRPGGPVAAR